MRRVPDDLVRHRVSSVFAICLTGTTLAFGELALAQQTPATTKLHYESPRDIPANCPPGTKIQFVVGTVRLYVDAHLLGTGTLIDLYRWVSGPKCPTWPVAIGSIEFSIDALKAIHAPAFIGHKTFALRLAANPSTWSKSLAALPMTGDREMLEQPDPSIENVTRDLERAGFQMPGVPQVNFRAYRIGRGHERG